MPRHSLSRSSLDLTRVAFLERLYRGKSVLAIGIGDGSVLEMLVARGASRVVGVDPDAQAVEAVRKRLGQRADLKVGGPEVAAGARFDVLLIAAGESLVAVRDPVPALRERLLPGGILVAAAKNLDSGESTEGVGYHEIRDRLALHFPSVTMLGQSAWSGASIAPFGDEEVEPVLDVSLAGEAAPELYVAIAGPKAVALPYGLIAGPKGLEAARPRRDEARPAAALAHGDADALRRGLAERDERIKRLETERGGLDEVRAKLVDRDRKLQRLEEERGFQEAMRATLSDREEKLAKMEAEKRSLVEELERRTGQGGQVLAEMRERLNVSEQALAAARAAALVHEAEMRARDAVLAERDAYIAEMERDMHAVEKVQAVAQAASVRADQVESRERQARRRIAELEGTLLRFGHAVPPAPEMVIAEPPPAQPSVNDAQVDELKQKVVELEARCEKLKTRVSDAEREAWAHLKARSDAEASAAEVREDTVRKLKDARKIATVELTRATEEAMKKSVSLKEELVRTERERKEAVANVAALKEELAKERASVEERVRTEAAAQAARALGDLEARVLAAEAERDRALSEREAALGHAPVVENGA